MNSESRNPKSEGDNADAWPEGAALQAQVLEALEEGVAVLDGEGRVRTWNGTLAYFSGLTSAQALGKPFLELAHPAALLAPALKQALTGTPSRVTQVCLEFPAAGAGGWFTVQLQPLRSPKGDIAGAVLVFHEVPVRREEPLALREDATAGAAEKPAPPPAELLLAMLNSARDVMLLLDSTGKVLAINDAALARIKRTREAVLGRYIGDFLPPEIARLRHSYGEKVMATGQTYVFEDERGGRWLENIFCPVPGADGRPAMVAAFSRDITHRKQAELERDRLVQDLRASEAQLRQSQLHLQTILDNASVVFWAVDREGMFTLSEGQVLHQLGLHPKHAVGRSAFEMYADNPAICADIRRALAGEKFAAIHETGGLVFDSRMAPLLDANGEIIGAIGVSLDITARVQAERALNQSQALYRQIVETAEEGIWLVDRNWHTTFANRRMEQMLGYGPGEMLGRHPDEFTDEAGRKIAAENYKRREQGQRETHDFKCLRKDGSEIWVYMATNPLLNAAGEFNGALAMVTDITERRAAESRIRAISNNLAHGMIYQILRLPDGRRQFTYLSEKVRDFYGITSEQGLADASLIYGRIHPDDLPRVAQDEERANQTLSEFRAEVRVFNPDQSLRWSYFVSNPARWADGTTCWDGLELDITDRKRAEEALRESEAKFRRLYDCMADALASTDMAGRILEANPAFVDLVGYSLTELRQMTYTDLTPQRWHLTEAKLLETKLLPTGSCPIYEKEYRHKDGRLIPVELRSFLMRDASGRPIGMWAIVRDITERQRMIESLRQSEERFSKAFHLSPVLMAISRIEDGLIVDVNERLLESFGLKREQALSHTSLELGLYDDAVQRAALIKELRARGVVQGFELTLNTARGRLEFLVSATVIHLNGQPHMLSLALDISKRKQAETRLQRRLEFEQAVAFCTARFMTGDSIDQAIHEALEKFGAFCQAERATLVRFDDDLTQGRLTHEWCAPGVSSQKAALPAFHTAACPWWRERVLRGEVFHVRDIAALPAAALAEREFLERLGLRSILCVPLWFGPRLAGLLCIDNPPAHLEWPNEDITQVRVFARILSNALARHQAEQALRDSEERYRAVFNGAAEGIVVAEVATRKIRYANSAFCAMSGYALDELVLLGVEDMHPKESLAMVIADFDAQTRGEKNLATDLPCLRKDGSVFYADINTGPLIVGGQRMVVGFFADITERKQAAQNIERSEARLRFLFENLRDTVSRHAPDSTFTYVSPACRKLTGFEPEDFLGRKAGEFVHPAEVEAVVQTILDAVERNAPEYYVSHRLRRKRGDYVWVETLGRLIYDDAGQLLEIQCAVRDISERKLVEENLREAMEFNRQVVASVEEGIVVTDLDFRIQVWNSFLERMTGIPFREVEGRDVREFAPRVKGLDQGASIQMVLAGKTVSSSTYHYELPTGKAGWASHRLMPLRNAEGRITGVVAVISEVTERQLAEEARRQSEERFRSAFDYAPMGVCMVDLAGRMLRCNHAALTLFGRTAEEITGKHYREFTHPEDVAASENGYGHLLAEGGQGYELEKRYHHKSGRVVWALVRVHLLKDAQGQPQCFLAHILDITARKEFEAQLKHSGEQMRALAARIEAAREEERAQIARAVHDDLGQALTGLKLDLAWLTQRLPADAGEARGRSEEMRALIDETINSVRRISSDLRPGLLDDLGLVAAIEWQAQEFERRTGVPCRFRTEGDFAEMESRRATALFRILQEALTNIIRHAEASRVSIRLTRDMGMASLEVRDNGRGITREQLNRPRSLGLLGIRERAFAFGGEVAISGRSGRGTVVVARMPLCGPSRDTEILSASELLARARAAAPATPPAKEG